MYLRSALVDAFRSVDDEILSGGEQQQRQQKLVCLRVCADHSFCIVYTYPSAVSDGSGSVAVVAVVAKTRIVIAHCGDAEAILWRGGTCVRRLVAAAATPIPVIATTHVVQLFTCSQGYVGATGPPMSLSVAVLRVLVRAHVPCCV